MAVDVGTVLTTILGGGTVAAVIGYFGNRRKDKSEASKNTSDVQVATFDTLTQMNERLKNQLAEVETQLDTERSARRALEDELASERRARRALEERVAALERLIPEGGTP
ncbi:hypothetical protein [Herbidospora daliensis]|uniref:hypothetical protein n=1 Tax=Herbidospora daliensis TaxID=295585 RepID=UPI000783F0BB|nr:hypothetical protein [Herbidospora daliensis]